MGIFNWNKKEEVNTSVFKSKVSNDVNDERYTTKDEIFKSYIPKFLYKPPFGYPRGINVPLIKTFGEFSYIYSVINLLQEEAAGNNWEIVPRDKTVRLEEDEQLQSKKDEIISFLNNPNGNKESFADLLKQVVRDICEIDSGVIVKVFNRNMELKQIFARDGGGILKNPDIYGYIGNRDDFIFPDREQVVESMTEQEVMKYYDLKYKERAAYFQYGWAVANMPIPFGKREIVYFCKNPRSDTVYGISPVQVLADIILTLVYGSQYNLDYYLNNNMPEGIVQVLGADVSEMKSLQQRLSNVTRAKDTITGFMRKVGFKIPVVNTEAKFIPFQLPSKDLQIIEQQQWFSKMVWSAFGVSAEDMGFNENSNKAVSQTQAVRYAKKAVRPILRLIEERINMEIMPEFDPECKLKFKFEDYDLDEDIKRYSLYETQIRIGVKTPEMVAEEEHIDLIKLENSKEKRDEENEDDNSNFYNSGQDKEDDKDDKNQDKKKEDDFKKDDDKNKKAKKKDIFDGTELEKFIVKEIERNAKEIKEKLSKYEVSDLDKI